MKHSIGLLMALGTIFYLSAAPRIAEIRTISNNILVVQLKSTIGNVSEANVELSAWKINDAPPLAINKYVMAADKSDHHIYLTTTTLVNGTSYKLSTPYGDTTIQFSDRTIFCEAIKTNQSAYSALAKNNYANFAIWLGDGGAKEIAGALPAYEVFEVASGKTVVEGTLKKIGSNPSSGDTVYRIDLSKVPEGGPYKISVKGYGCSYPFGIGGDFSRRLAYILFRGQYYQRCGCPVKPPYALDIRQKACHTTIYKVNGPIGEANITVAGTEPTFSCYGGYHDAGDADRRAYHMSNPVINLMVYEAFPDLFTDGQYNIPDKFDNSYNIIGKGNGIPDIIDEAAWGTLVWEYLQNDDGSIQFGTETSGYPDPFAAPLDLDQKKYGTVKIDDRAAAIGSGLFLHLARIMKPYDSTRAAVLAARGEKSYSYINAKMKNPEKLYYNIQKYLYDGDEAAHEQVKTLKTAVDNYKANTFRCYGYQINDNNFDNPGYIISYMVEKKRPTDSAVVNYFKNALKAAADANLAEVPKYAYPVGNNPTGTTWGHNVMQPLYACAPLLYWRFSKEQPYLDGACELMNYQLGLNPLGISYVAGLGFHPIHNPHDREYTYLAESRKGPKPGITIFGPGVIQNIGSSTNVLRTWPEIANLPVERKFGDDPNSISTNEFTIFETMSHYALYTVLANGGTWDETKDPFITANSAVIAPSAPPSSGSYVKGWTRGSQLILTLSLPEPDLGRGALYLTNGKLVARFSIGKLRAGKTSVIIDKIVPDGLEAVNGVMVCAITTEKGIRMVATVSCISK